MKSYIFLSREGYTFQPNSSSAEPDIENLQVIGISNGRNAREAFQRLLEENDYLLGTSFDELFSYELSKDYENTREYFYLSKPASLLH
ncbi:MAG: hypothetical protein GXP46_10890 [Deferribacteres bacterium]|nr:hypothetical protein [Deferribacteres bacterium]